MRTLKKILIFVPGILTFPGASRNWSGRAVTWTHIHTEARAEKVEYFCGPIGRAFGQKQRAEKLAATLNHYAGDWEITLVGHSNGADVILDCLSVYPYFPRISSLHLVNAACQASFERNGLNQLIAHNRVGEVFVYVAKKDLALRLASTVLGRRLGYGTLGLHGPRHLTGPSESRTTKILWPDWGHSDCWDDPNLDETLTNFINGRDRSPSGPLHSPS